MITQRTMQILKPGTALREILEERSILLEDFAKKIDVTENYLKAVMSGKYPISRKFASRLEYVLNINSSFWVGLQEDYNKEKVRI